MSDQAWNAWLIERNHELEREVGLLRQRLYKAQARTDLWRHRALLKSQPRTKSLPPDLTLAEGSGGSRLSQRGDR